MIENLNTWAKTIVLAIIVVSILEMLLPNNKTKKYVKMIMGIFILYNIVSPLIKDESSISFAEMELDDYTNTTLNSIEINQESMDKRLEELYINEIEKDIIKKVEKKGYIVKSCKVDARISDNEDDTGIKKIILKVEKGNKIMEKDESSDVEDKIVSEIQKIKKIDTSISNDEKDNEDKSLEQTDRQNLKKFLIEEYEVSEKCLEIN